TSPLYLLPKEFRMELIQANEHDVTLIRDLAAEIWWHTYKPILSEKQISFMLEDMYSENALTKQMQEGLIFILAKREGRAIAFAGYSIEKPVLKIHKLYI